MVTNRLAAAIACGVLLSACANPPGKVAHPEVATDPYLVRWQSLSRQVDRLESTEEGVAYERELFAVHNMF